MRRALVFLICFLGCARQVYYFTSNKGFLGQEIVHILDNFARGCTNGSCVSKAFENMNPAVPFNMESIPTLEVLRVLRDVSDVRKIWKG